MPAAREWVKPSSEKKKKVKFFKPASSMEPSRGTAPPSTSGKPATPVTANNPFAVLGKKPPLPQKIRIPSGNPPEAEERVPGDPTQQVEESSLPGKQPVMTSLPNPDEEEGEVIPCDADIPDSMARALLDALQDKRRGHQLPAAMVPLARIRASQLQQCIAKGTEPTEAIVQTTLDLISMGQGPADPLALADKMSMVNQTPDVQLNAVVPAQDSSSIINTTARAEVTADPLYTALAHNSSTSPTALIPGPNHMGQHHANSFQMSANDVPEQLVLRGTSDEDVPAILAQFRKRVELKGDLHVLPPEIDNRAVRFLPLLLKSIALETYSQLTLGVLEWRSESTLSNLKLHQMDVTPVVPRSWSDWVEALTVMFAPPNLLANLCREIATLRQSDEKHPGGNVDQYALRISSLFTKLLTEATLTTPPGKSAQIFASERLKIAVFENGLLPAIRLEQIREDPANSFASARDRARKHASNNLHGVNVTNLSSVLSTTPSLKNQLATRLDNVQASIDSLVEAPTPPRKQKCGRSKSERQATQGRRDNSASRRERSSSKAKTPRST